MSQALTYPQASFTWTQLQKKCSGSLLGGPEWYGPGTDTAPLVGHSVLLKQSHTVPHKPVDAVQHRLPRPGRQGAIVQSRPDVRQEVHLEEGVGDLGLRQYRILYSNQLNYKEIGVAPARDARIAKALE